MIRRPYLVAVTFILGLVLALGLLVPAGPLHHFWEKIPLFEAIFGFFGCLVIIFVSKALGQFFIQKREDYYND
jgi:hypothetical protein